ncbi:MAG: toll/interleukin-1 receptor domain-containing protein [Capsulimonadaceae bacterium]
MALNLQMLTNNGLFDKLANNLGTDAIAQIVLVCAGFPDSQIPGNAPNASRFWLDICRAIEAGTEPGNFEDLLRCAHQRLPKNPHFLPYAALPAGVAGAAAAASAAPTYSPGFPGQFDAFISYSSGDRVEVQRVHDALSKRGLRIWMDQYDIPLGQPFRRHIESILGDVKAVVVCVGANALGPWQSAEVDIAVDRQARGRCITIPLCLSGVALTELPLLLARLNGCKLSGGPEDEAVFDRVAKAIRNVK